MSTADVELAIDSIAAGGDGVGRHEGLVVFVPRTAPGDVVRARMTSRGRFARGALVDVVAPSASRVDPPCPHYVGDRCGGCQLQHLAYDAQLAAKRGVVRDALQRIGGRVPVVPELVASASPWRYRRKLTLALRWAGSGWIAGLHAYDDPRRVFDLVDCPITDERVLRVWGELRAAFRFLPRVRELRVSVRLLADGAAVVVDGAAAWPTRARFFDAAPSVRALWWERAGPASRQLVASRGDGDRDEAGASFVQVNADAAALLADHVVAAAHAHAPSVVVDAYAGRGDTAVRLAAGGARVVALEVDPEASAVCARRLPAGSRAVRGRVEETLAGALPADVVVLNPPRAGLHERVPELLEAPGTGHRAVIYVSCNPATLARDLARLPGHELIAVRAFDMFPQTAHVETVCELIRRTS